MKRNIFVSFESQDDGIDGCTCDAKDAGSSGEGDSVDVDNVHMGGMFCSRSGGLQADDMDDEVTGVKMRAAWLECSGFAAAAGPND